MSVKNVTIKFITDSASIEQVTKQFDNLTEAEREAANAAEQVGRKQDQAAKQGTAAVNQQAQGMDKLSGMVKGVGAAVVAAFAVERVIAFGQRVVEVTAKFQKLEAQLQTSLGDASSARNAMAEIAAFAAKTPFQVDELTDSFNRLASRGIIPNQDEMRKLGDLAASQGKGFLQLTEAVLDAGAGEFERLKEFGIRASAEGDRVRIAFGKVNTTIARTPEAITAAIVQLGDLQGVAGGMARVSATLGGQISNMGDSFDRLFKAIGSAGAPVFTAFLGILNEATNATSDWLEGQTDAEGTIGRVATELNAEFGALRTLNLQFQAGTVSQQVYGAAKARILDLYKSYIPEQARELNNLDQIAIAQQAVTKSLYELTFAKLKAQLVDEQSAKIQASIQSELEAQRRIQELSARDLTDSEQEELRNLQNIVATQRMRLDVDAEWGEGRIMIEEGINQYAKERIALEQQNAAELDALRNLAARYGIELDTIVQKTRQTTEATSATAREFKKRDADRITLLDKINFQLSLQQDRLDRIKRFTDGINIPAVLTVEELQAQEALIRQLGETLKFDLEDPIKDVDAAQEIFWANFGENADKANAQIQRWGTATLDVLNRVSEFVKVINEQRIAQLDAEVEANNEQIESNNDRLSQLEAAEQNATGNRRRELQRQIAAVQASTEAELQANEQLEAQKRQLQRETAAIAKAINIAQAIANTALAVTKALASVPPPANFVLAGLVGAAGAIQIATIAAQPFKDGVIGLQGPGSETSDSIPARLSRGESVIPARRTREFRSELEAIMAGDRARLAQLAGRELINPMQRVAGAPPMDERIVGELRNVQQALKGLPLNQFNLDERGFNNYLKRGGVGTEYKTF